MGKKFLLQKETPPPMCYRHLQRSAMSPFSISLNKRSEGINFTVAAHLLEISKISSPHGLCL